MDQLKKLAELVAKTWDGAAVEVEFFANGWIVRVAVHAQIKTTEVARNLDDAVANMLSKMETL